MSKFAARVLCCALAFFACAFFLLLTSPLAAQEVTATISGTVTDPSGEIIPAVNVEVTNPDTGARSTAVTGARGDYMLPLLRPGRYQMTISHPGFRTYQRSNIVLEGTKKPTSTFAWRLDRPPSVSKLRIRRRPFQRKRRTSGRWSIIPPFSAFL